DRVLAEEKAAEQRKRRLAEEQIASEKRQRENRNRDALVGSLKRCEYALAEDDAFTARLALDDVEKRLPEGGTDDFESRVSRCRTDLTILEELDHIDELRLTEVTERWAVTFRAFGIVPGETPLAEAIRRIDESHVQERLLATLELWHGG